MKNNRYTPATLDQSFIIPLYQRLFEWEETEVVQLLNDLYSSFNKDPESPYHIGMLTVYKEASGSRYSLVDGQQRFTVLNLMGVVFEWKDFLKSNDDYRLSFFARKNDQDYLINKIENQELDYVNDKMETAIACITDFVEDRSDIEDFKNYIKTKTTFFLSELPQDYTVQDLNRYFEAMNEAGKGLENHEILKVQLLREANKLKKVDYTKIWNVISEMDKCLIRQKESELQKDYRNRLITTLKEDGFSLSSIESDKVESDCNTISEIKASPTKPNESDSERGEKAVLGFSDFLLQVLWLCIPKNERINSTNFFNKSNLLETFNQFIIEEGSLVEIDTFFNSILRYRIMFDYFIIRLNNEDNRNTNYSLNMTNDSQELHIKQSVIQFQSMLYVSSQSYVWLTPILENLNRNIDLKTGDYLNDLKNWDNNHHNNSSSLSLNYGSINRYWFWRLDYYLWEDRQTHFDDEPSRKIASNYIFRINRSIEHIAPQAPKRESNIKLNESYLHLFGNLAMISAGQNSSLQNESFEVKKAHIESFLIGSVGGSVESLKMLNLHKYDTWNMLKLTEHHNDMLDILMNSFRNSPGITSNNYDRIIELLQENKIVHV